MPQNIRLNLLGPFEARRPDGEIADLASRKVQALLAYLAVEHGRSHTREHLAGLLWGETGDERARHNLRQALSKIRRFSPDLVIGSGDSLRIDLAGCGVDVIEFERLAQSDDPDELKRCVDLYRGELLEGVIPREPGYDEWLLLARGRLRRIACHSAERLSSSLASHGRPEEAIEALNHRLSMDPACEPAHRDLMELLARIGRRSDALRQYKICEEALERELGAAPSSETKALRERLLKEEPESGAVETAPPAPTSTRVERDRPAVAVLPFDNLSGEAESYFVDGIVEDIITSLSCFQSLIVIARGSSFAYRDKQVPERQIASELGAQFLVRGSVQRAGPRVRINIQLLDAPAGLLVWGHRFDREMEDVFLVQDEISSTVVSTLAGRVEAASLARARKAPAERLEAYDLLLRGKEHHHRYTAEDCRACIDLFGRAIEQDPDYAVAHAWLACGLGQAINFGLDEEDKLVEQAQAAATRGLELNQNESECHRILAQVFLTKCDHKRSIWHQERALFLNPNDDRSVCAMGEILAFAGRPAEAEEWVRKSMRLNPYHPPRYWTHLGRSLLHQERYEEALDALGQVGSARPDDLFYMMAAGARLGRKKDVGRCAKELEKQVPGFEPGAFVASLPYAREAERRFLLESFR